MQDDIVKVQPGTEKPKSEQKVVQDIVTTPPVQKSDIVISKKEPVETAGKSEQPVDNHASEAPHKKKSTAPKGVVAAAFILCFGLIGFSVYIAMSESEKTDTATTQSQAGAQVQTAKPTTTDVQGAIDQTDKLPEPVDDPEAELTDQTLGL